APRRTCEKHWQHTMRENCKARTMRSMKRRKIWRRRLSRKRCRYGPGSARVSRVGFGVSPKHALRKFAMTRRVRYPEGGVAPGLGVDFVFARDSSRSFFSSGNIGPDWAAKMYSCAAGP